MAVIRKCVSNVTLFNLQHNLCEVTYPYFKDKNKTKQTEAQRIHITMYFASEYSLHFVVMYWCNYFIVYLFNSTGIFKRAVSLQQYILSLAA